MKIKDILIIPCLIFAFGSCKQSSDKNAINESAAGTKAIITQRETVDINPGANDRPIDDLIQVKTPAPNAAISSPLKIMGKARGYWYFEVDFPVTLVDSAGHELGIAIAKAEGDWMTEDFTDFSAELKFEVSQATQGYLIFSRSNASGLPEHDRALKVPVNIKP